jgi:hypothetical protein
VEREGERRGVARGWDGKRIKKYWWWDGRGGEREGEEKIAQWNPSATIREMKCVVWREVVHGQFRCGRVS